MEIREQLKLAVDAKEYEAIRDEWKRHSIAEDARDIAGLISTLTPDCCYELVGTPHLWNGHEGAKQFYTQLLTAIPDIKFDLKNIVIGPQGVFEDAHVTGTHTSDLLNYRATGKKIQFQVAILFQWDPKLKKFRGERMFADLKTALS